MYKNASEKYQAMSRYLLSEGIECEIYPHGSFALGTITRPFENGNDCDYDIDMVCELTADKEKTSARQTKWVVGSALQRSELYSSKNLKEWDRCWTLSYAKQSGDIGFSMDILPSVHESRDKIDQELKYGTSSTYAEKSIAITNKHPITKNYSWSQSNPRGYKMWFDSINEPFLVLQRELNRQQLFERNRDIYNSVEDVPPMLERSSLQRVIQLLKRHRDMFYSVAKRDNKPISAIITTLCAQIAQTASPQITVHDLLQYVVKTLGQYSGLSSENHMLFETNNPTLTHIRNDGSKWTVRNPVNHNDNYTENWTNEDVTFFFRWLEAVRADLIDSINESEETYFASLDRGIGKNIRLSTIPNSVNINFNPQVGQTKPWRE
jgi:hypothetical protein